MGDLYGVSERKCSSWKDRLVFGISVFIASVLIAGQAMAIEVDLFGKNLSIKGYINQGVQFGVAGDGYTTMQGFQQAITQALLELEYYPRDNLKLFMSGLLYKDWAYNIYDSDDEWEERLFKNARNEMSLRTDYEDVLKECHVTLDQGPFNIRVGKQIVSWGRMDGVRIMDQVNPKDQRLGPSDIEFETSIIPIWLAKVDYYPEIQLPLLDEFSFEFIFNPNADFIADKSPGTGNYVHGIWAANVVAPGIRIGKMIGTYGNDSYYREPDKWTDGHEYMFRLKGTLPDATYLTLNFFDGVDDNPVFHSTGGANVPGWTDDKGLLIIEPIMTGKFCDKRFAGLTFARNFESLYIRALGGVAPLIRFEALYEFDTYFSRSNKFDPSDNGFEQRDAIYWGAAFDWKFKFNLLNERRFFSLVPQFTHRHIRDYPSGPNFLSNAGGTPVSENVYSFSVRSDTWYLHDKLNPFIYYQRDITQDVTGSTSGSLKSDLWLFRLSYVPNSTWTFRAQLSLFSNDGYDPVDHYDNLSFTVQYQF